MTARSDTVSHDPSKDRASVESTGNDAADSATSKTTGKAFKTVNNNTADQVAIDATNDVANETTSTAANDAVHEKSVHTRWQRFQVPYKFPVVFTTDLFATDNPCLIDALTRLEPDKRHRLIVFIDGGLNQALPTLAERVEHYAAAHATALDLVCAPCIVNGGETIKSDFAALGALQALISDHSIDRHSYVVAIGGGALLDAVGLVAATAHRGIRHIRIPSTVLAQNDSGVGVKNGVNQFGQKNYLGTFAPPFAVLNDRQLLESLPARERRAGMAEAVKVALIRDEGFFGWLEQNAVALAAFDQAAVAYSVRRCAELHMHQIAHGGDPFELGSARPLDFGHWAAHRLETLTAHALRHGEAVAIGMAIDVRYSVKLGLLDEPAERRIQGVLETLGFTLWHTALDHRNLEGVREVLAGLSEFQAHLGGALTITLLAGIGTGVEVHEMNHSLLDSAIDDLRQRHNGMASSAIEHDRTCPLTDCSNNAADQS